MEPYERSYILRGDMAIAAVPQLEAGQPEARVTKITIIPHGEPIFCERATSVEIADEAAGEYVVIRQCHDQIRPGQVDIDPADWPLLRETLDKTFNNCRS